MPKLPRSPASPPGNAKPIKSNFQSLTVRLAASNYAGLVAIAMADQRSLSFMVNKLIHAELLAKGLDAPICTTHDC